MRLGATGGTRARWCIWALGTVLTLGYYFVGATRGPRRTAVGVERRLFGLGELSLRFMEATGGGRWLLVPDDEPLYVTGTLSGLPLLQRLQSFEWPTVAVPSRRFSPFAMKGTWQLHGASPRRVWSLAARGWLDDRHLWSDLGWGADPWVLDLHRRRVARGRWADVEGLFYPSMETASLDYEELGWEPRLTATLSSVLDGLPQDLLGAKNYNEYPVGRERVLLVHSLDAAEEPVALYAVSDDPAPRILMLARRAEPLAMSRDGRTLFFRREGALWRLELRRPLPHLLQEAPVPTLPDPLARR
jgi:hypothetical protein